MSWQWRARSSFSPKLRRSPWHRMRGQVLQQRGCKRARRGPRDETAPEVKEDPENKKAQEAERREEALEVMEDMREA